MTTRRRAYRSFTGQPMLCRMRTLVAAFRVSDFACCACRYVANEEEQSTELSMRTSALDVLLELHVAPPPPRLLHTASAYYD